jgi:hypothetical protein
MSLLDWNSIENSRHGIAVSNRVQSKTIPLLLSEFEWGSIVSLFILFFLPCIKWSKGRSVESMFDELIKKI